MIYKVRYSKTALKQLKKLDKQTSSIIISFIEKKLENCDNPRVIGKALQGDLKDKWRYRVGNYRILAKIDDCKITIVILELGHRRDIYQ